MKYKTCREAYKPHTIALLVIAIGAVLACIIAYLIETNEGMIPFYAVVAVLGMVGFIYCWSEKHIRNYYYCNGKRYDAVIVGAEWLFNGGGEDTYYLIIAFYDDSKRLLYRKTNGYVGSPNVKLKSSKCAVYEWKGKYMEGDFQTVEKGTKGCLDIPVTKYKQLRTKGKNYV